MFENLEEGKNNTPAASGQPAVAPQFPPQAKVEDIFSGVKDTGTPLTKGGKTAPEPIKVANRTKGGGGMVMKLLIAIIVILVLAIAGLVVASQYFGFTGLKDLVSGATERVSPQQSKEVAMPEKEAAQQEVVQDPAGMPDQAETQVPAGMPETNETATTSMDNPPSGLPEVETTASSSGTAVSTTTAENDTAMGEQINDADGDMLIDREEVVLGTDPTKPDTDGDGLLDGEEVNAYKTSPLKVDTDNDELSDYEEVKKYLTDPNNPDTDADSYLDGKEVKGGYNPKGPGPLLPVK